MGANTSVCCKGEQGDNAADVPGDFPVLVNVSDLPHESRLPILADASNPLLKGSQEIQITSNDVDTENGKGDNFVNEHSTDALDEMAPHEQRKLRSTLVDAENGINLISNAGNENLDDIQSSNSKGKATKKNKAKSKSKAKAKQEEQVQEAEESRYDFVTECHVTFKEMCEKLSDRCIFHKMTQAQFSEHWESLLDKNGKKKFMCKILCKCAWKQPLCVHGHKLGQPAANRKFCDICRWKGISFSCEESCNFDTCARCYKKMQTVYDQACTGTPLCPKGHLMVAQNMEFACDLCDIRPAQYGCSNGCNYDVCEFCYNNLKELGSRVAAAKDEGLENAEASDAAKRGNEHANNLAMRGYGRLFIIGRENLWKLLKRLLALRPKRNMMRYIGRTESTT